MSKKVWDYVVIGSDNQPNERSLSTDDFEMCMDLVNKRGGTIYVPMVISPICNRCGDSMVPQQHEGSVIGWHCGDCWDDWDNEEIKDEN